MVPIVPSCPLPWDRTCCQGAALELRRRKGPLLFPESVPIQELGSGSGYPLRGFWRAQTSPFSHCHHSCRDLSPSCGRTGGTRMSRSSEQLHSSSFPIRAGPAQLPAPFPIPRGDKLSPREATPGLSPHRGDTAPTHSSLTARAGAAGLRVQPSLPCSHPCRTYSLPVLIPPFPVPGWHTGSVPQPNPECHRKMVLLLLPVLPPPLPRQAVPECERKLLRR